MSNDKHRVSREKSTVETNSDENKFKRYYETLKKIKALMDEQGIELDADRPIELWSLDELEEFLGYLQRLERNEVDSTDFAGKSEEELRELFR